MKIKYLFVLWALLTMSFSWSLPAPKYLSVPHWQSCTQSISKETAVFVCLPKKRPAKCPRASFKQLTDQQLIEKCDLT